MRAAAGVGKVSLQREQVAVPLWWDSQRALGFMVVVVMWPLGLVGREGSWWDFMGSYRK
jgi:hypothetical protein